MSDKEWIKGDGIEWRWDGNRIDIRITRTPKPPELIWTLPISGSEVGEPPTRELLARVYFGEFKK